MRYEDFGPVANPDGSPTEMTRQMLAGTGRDPVEFAKGNTMHTMRKQTSYTPDYSDLETGAIAISATNAGATIYDGSRFVASVDPVLVAGIGAGFTVTLRGSKSAKPFRFLTVRDAVVYALDWYNELAND